MKDEMPRYDGDCSLPSTLDSDNRAAVVVVSVIFLLGAAAGFAVGVAL